METTHTDEYLVKDKDGALIAIHKHVRDPETDEKQCYWLQPDRTPGLNGTRLEELPLYGVHETDEGAALSVLVEGEKARDALADALKGTGVNVLGTVTGASQTPGPEALEILEGHEVVLWPDADDPGSAHMMRVAQRLQGIAAMVRVFDWPEALLAEDAADHPAVTSKSEKAIDRLLNDLCGAPEFATNGHKDLFSSSLTPLGDTSDDENNEVQWFHELGEPKEREFVIEDIAMKGYPVIAYGAGGVAKSFTMLAGGISIASSSVDKWLGFRVQTHGYVLYIDFELDVDEQHRRVRDLCNGLGILTPKKLAYLSGVGVSTDTTFSRAYSFCREYEPVAVIIDSAGMAMVGDMDRAKDVTAFYRHYVEPFRRLGVTPFLVDHEGKRQAGEKHKDKSPIGSVYKTNNSRGVLQFILDEYDKENSALDIQVRQFKTNNKPLDPFGLRITFGNKKVTLEERELPDEELIDEERKPVRERIHAALSIEPHTVPELEKATGAAAGTIYNNLSRMVEAEEVVEDGYKGRKKVYRLFSSSSTSPRGGSDDENKNHGEETLTLEHEERFS